MTSVYRRFLVPGISTLIMLAVLLGLGTWQVYRLNGKRAFWPELRRPKPRRPCPGNGSGALHESVGDRSIPLRSPAQFGAEVRDTRTGPTMGFYQIVPLEREERPLSSWTVGGFRKSGKFR